MDRQENNLVDGAAAYNSRERISSGAATFQSILFPGGIDPQDLQQAPDFFPDLNLDQIVSAITIGWDEYSLVPFFHQPLHDSDTIAYRQEIMRDLEDSTLMQAIRSFSQRMRAMRQHLQRASKGYYRYEKQRWFLDAVQIYCDAIQQLQQEIAGIDPGSRGLRAFGEFLGAYVASARFIELAAQTRKLTSEIASIRYALLIREGKYTVCRYDGEIDYSTDVEQTFEKFRRGAVKNYLAELSPRTGMNHIQAQILEGVSKLYPHVFEELDSFNSQRADYLEPTIARFDRELQFYVAYLDYVKKFRAAGLSFCYPYILDDSKEISAHATFDAALARKCVEEKAQVVTNDFAMKNPERFFVVTGPNQGGKTTFARTFGQLHYLAALGCPVPGTHATLFLFDRIFTHFEKEEDITNLRGKLHDDLVRIRQILDQATPRSIVILNELFSSTTLQDAIYLSRNIMKRLCELDLLGVWVTFLTELATFSPKTVSMVSNVDPANPAIRTLKIERRPARGLAHAVEVAQIHAVTYESIKERINP